MLSLIVALSNNSAIGLAGRLPWHLRGDLQHFRQTTWGHHLILGRKTFESIGRPLPGRTSIVLTRNADYRPEGVLTARDLDEALRLATGDEEPFVAGGAEIYRLALPRAGRMYITRVDADVEADAFFPAFDPADWRLTEQTDWQSKPESPLRYRFEIHDRV